MYIVSQHNNQPLLDGPLHLDVTFYMPIPKMRVKKIKKGQPHLSRPDLDNLIKFVADICLNIIYKDDAIISSIHAKKIYENNARTEFKFTKLGEENDKKV